MKRRRQPKEGRGPIKRRGWLAAALSIGFLLFGLAFGLAEYFIAAAVCALLLLLAALQAAGQRPRCELRAASGRITRGEAGKVLLKLSNPYLWPLFPLRLHLDLQKDGQDPAELAYFETALKPREEKTLEIELICPHRGEYTVSLRPYFAEDMVGFFALPRRAAPPHKLLALPRLHLSTEQEQEGAILDEEEKRRQWQWQHGQLTAEPRAYLQGDALHAIHWKKSASRRELFSRLREHTSEYSCCLLVDNRPAGVGEEALDYEDRLCEAVLSFLFTQVTGNRPLTLLPGGLTLQTAHGLDNAAEFLATLPFAGETVLGELETLLENQNLPAELYIALAQSPAPLLPFMEQLVNSVCRVVLLAPASCAAQLENELTLALPLIGISLPASLSAQPEV